MRSFQEDQKEAMFMTAHRYLKSMKALGICLFLLLGLSRGRSAEAYESFVVTIDFYQGFSVSQGFEIDSHVLTIIFNPSEKVEWVLPGPEVDLFSFDFSGC